MSYGPDEHVVDDPYRFLPTLGEMDLHLVNEGRHEQLWEVLGARVHHYPGALEPVTGTSFAVWAPNARAIRIKGDFNSWDGREHPMRQLGTSGVWELFVPDVGVGAAYKYVILGPDGQWREKADPMAFWAEKPADTASKVFESSYSWGDSDWMTARAAKQPVAEPMSIYEMHLGSWKKHHDGRYWSWEELADELPAYLADLGYTHVELMPVMQHPFGGSWGYHVTSYFAPDSRFGDPDGFRLLVDRLHQAGVGVILDWVPGHFATDEWALARFDGTPLYEDPNPQRAGTRSGARTSSTSAGARCATSSTPTRSTGSRSSTPTGCAWTASRRCSTSTTPARPASGPPTSTAATRTSRRCSSSRR